MTPLINRILFTLVNALGFTSAVFVGIWIDLIYLVSPKLAHKLLDMVLEYTEVDDDEGE